MFTARVSNCFFKDVPEKDLDYLAWIKSLPCVVTQQPADDPHHLLGHGYSGTGTKVSDYWTFPLTRIEHTELHDIGWQEWEAKYGSQWKFIAQTLRQAIQEGVLKTQ